MMSKTESIRLLISDLDGTLTDGKYIVSSKGTVSKSFYTRDFYGLELAIRSATNVLILTSSEDAAISHKIHSLTSDIKRHIGVAKLVENKFAYLEESLSRNNIDWAQVAYIGDADNDIEAMKKSGVCGCPADAVRGVKEVSDYICKNPGGYGAVYEFVIWLFDNHMLQKR